MGFAGNDALVVRLAAPTDEAFLFELYASTRAEELAAWGWDAAQQTAFLQLQFRGQQHHYAAYPDTKHYIIERTEQTSGEPHTRAIGRLLTSRPDQTDEIRLVDVALLPEARGAGIGTALVQWVQAQAQYDRKAVRLHVAPDNPARRLYERLGFQLIEDRGSHLFMEWRAAKEHTTHAG